MLAGPRMNHGGTAAEYSDRHALRGSTGNEGRRHAAILDVDLSLSGRTEVLERAARGTRPQAHAGQSQRDRPDELRGLAFRFRSLRVEGIRRRRISQSDGATRPNLPQSLPGRRPQEKGPIPPARLD